MLKRLMIPIAISIAVFSAPAFAMKDIALREAGDSYATFAKKCSGTLIKDEFDKGAYFLVSPDKHESDIIDCIFSPIYNKIVLKACKVGAPCTIYGDVEGCREHEQCIAVTNVTSAHARK